MLMTIHANRYARVCYEEAFKYACKRETFDKKLIEHPVIREKLAHMIKKIESTHALLERYEWIDGCGTLFLECVCLR
jgi:alkylation response protein AidB-like acyl-CoA dehydrogenase